MSFRLLKTIAADLVSIVRYGRNAALKNYVLWIDLSQINMMIDSQSAEFQNSVICCKPSTTSSSKLSRLARRELRRKHNVVTGGDFDRYVVPLSHDETFQRMKNKIQHDLSWEEAGFVDWMMKRIEENGSHDGCHNRDDVLRRYANLDRLIALIRSGKTYTVPASHITRYGGADGIFVAVGRNGEVLFCGRGKHRLAIAQYLGAPLIPVCVCAVHEIAVQTGHWRKLKDRSRVLSQMIGKQAAISQSFDDQLNN